MLSVEVSGASHMSETKISWNRRRGFIKRERKPFTPEKVRAGVFGNSESSEIEDLWLSVVSQFYVNFFSGRGK